MIRGISTRDYEGTLDGTLTHLGISKSSVDRAFVRKAMQNWKQLQERDLSPIEAWAVLIDGIHIKKEAIGIAALAYTISDDKEALGFWEGSTESAENVDALLRDLERRGFNFKKIVVYILDGSKGEISALERRFGRDVKIVRCFVYKLRNLKEWLPKDKHWAVTQKLHLIRDATTEAQAKTHFDSLARWLKEINISAYKSIQEAGPYLTMLQRLGVPLELRKAIQSTNAIESMFFVGPRKVSRNVKRWRNSMQRQRYLVIGFLEAQRRFRKIRGYKMIKPWLLSRGLWIEEKIDSQRKVG